MRKLAALVVLAVLVLAADQGARVVAERTLAARARAASRGPDSAEATIRSLPFLGRLVASGSVPSVAVRVTGAMAGPVRLAAVDVVATGVRLDRRALLGGHVRLNSIEAGMVSVELDGPSITGVVDLPVTVAGGRVTVGAAGVGVDAEVALDRRGALVLRVAGLEALSVPVVRTALVPCAATSVAVVGDRVRLTCEVDELPDALRR